MTSLAVAISTCLHVADYVQYDVIQKTGITQHIATPPEEDRSTAMGNVYTVGQKRWATDS